MRPCRHRPQNDEKMFGDQLNGRIEVGSGADRLRTCDGTFRAREGLGLF